MSISDKDWDLLNGYADEELSASDIQLVKARIAREPELREALSQIQEMKRHIKSSYTKSVDQEPKHPEKSTWVRASIAAAICLVVGSGIFAWSQYDQFTRSNPEKLHQAYSIKGYMLEKTPKVIQVSSQITGDFKIPDLSASELKLAEANLDVVNDKEVITAHYRGMRGCRLTFVSVGLSDSDNKDHTNIIFNQSEQQLTAEWQSKHSQMTLLATGMDESRFAAIARFIKHEIKSMDEEKQAELRMAMETTYRKALPCA
ncbi:MAG: hypothetical protein JJ879_00400 [Sneathiella sp.]|nr:hypothetical protein [Sneathiella sp.]